MPKPTDIGNLILERKEGEEIVVHTADGDIVIKVTEIVRCSHDKVKLCIQAPKWVQIHRREVLERIENEREKHGQN